MGEYGPGWGRWVLVRLTQELQYMGLLGCIRLTRDTGCQPKNEAFFFYGRTRNDVYSPDELELVNKVNGPKKGNKITSTPWDLICICCCCDLYLMTFPGLAS